MKPASWLFPEEPRDFPFRRALRTVLRAAHIFSSGTLLGGTLFDVPPNALTPWLHSSLLSGMALLLTDLHASLAILFEVRGLAALLKLILLCGTSLVPSATLPLLIATLVIGTVSSHMPGRYRHKMLFGRQFKPDRRKG